MLAEALFFAMTEVTPIDDRGRFTVRPEYRRALGRRVLQIMTPHGLLLRPVRGALARRRLPPALAATGEDAGLDEVG